MELKNDKTMTTTKMIATIRVLLLIFIFRAPPLRSITFHRGA